jgi:hypothetical protein
VAALSESVNATEERRNQGGRVAEERLSPNPRIEDPRSPNPRIEDPRSPNPRIEDPNPGERRSLNPRIEDHLPDNYRSPLSKNAMPAEESLDFKRAFKVYIYVYRSLIKPLFYNLLIIYIGRSRS